ncbi:bifunctional serine/threonine-protein kinase/ABC transporter substrate-binding protein [Streptomyces sp. CFMR 7]|uniref:bifunctional serine/threonine-protein kinase/ABC transporter substrate-binding protein n=1 Tax=Streptomyces sp. CFMR 7 TaxID=1649184 RepID=UPI0011A53388|nr:bifunctional serine/threonine-protein kinase/ABC transporter substrate-binding protein [Streptomyces sp. CFMR 7]
MRPLTSQDPRAVGPYRTLARLGAGGMGVVYLARSAGGALAAVKVIRAEHAADPRFRARFRREAEAAGRITGPWVVPVLGADTEAREPWLATAFVPGPSLGEVVDARGALPAATVRALGARLAAALATVHAGGLIHRDVKPGNILLALDGPRLIDFGIARHPGATALTATDAVLGTPGYLAPEQASAGPVGPACDVFSLGCVLVYAATGRPPFGAGGAAGVLFRTVHEEPDLDGVPPALLPLVTACLTKTPDTRPTAGEVRDRLRGGAEASPGEGGAGRGAGGGRGGVAAPGSPGTDGGGGSAGNAGAGGGGDAPGSAGAGGAGAVGGRDPREALAREPMPPALWALPGLPALIAERSAAALALPDPDPNPAPDATPPDGAPPAPSPTRRRLLTAGAVGAVLLAGGSAAVWSTTRRRTGPSGALPTRTIGLHADLTGPGRAAGLAHRRGAELAVADHNSRTGQAFRLALRIEDDAGEAARALRVADQLVADSRVMAVLGPTGDVLPEDVVLRYGKGRLTTVVVAAGVTTADSHANLPLCVTRPYDRNLGPALVSYLVHSRPAGRILLVPDAADPERGWQLGSSFRDAAPAGVTLTEHPLPEGESGFGPAARRATAVRADAVVYAGGSPSRAARLAAALAAEGFTGTRVGAGPALGPAFLRGAGRAADGWVFAEAYADAAALPSAAGFTAAHRRRFGAPPATWAAEAYDGVGLIARAAAATSAGGEGREGLAQRLVRTEHPGIVRTLAFSPSTRRIRYENGIFLYRVERGRPRFLGPYGEV